MSDGRPMPLTEEDLLAVRSDVGEARLVSGEYDSWRPMRFHDTRRAGPVGGVDPDFGEMRNIIPAPGDREPRQPIGRRNCDPV
ncbi:MAG: hypothetical protein O3B73_12830 [bacterium]|nr:hypothetical protein [bacterium]